MVQKEFRAIDKRALHNAIKNLYESKLVDEKKNADGSITLVLTEEGKKRALTYHIDTMKLTKPKQWDKKWRVVLFDIPEKYRKSRDVLRHHLQSLNFFELQKSVFVYPYDCKDEIEYLIEFYTIRKFVRFMVAESIDNELYLKRHFKLLEY